MRIMLIAHIGETLGHIIRGLSIAKELINRGCQVEIVASPRATEAIRLAGLHCDFSPIRWNWSHNSCELDGLSSNFLGSIVETTEDLLEVVKQRSPDFILSMPGFASAQIARHYEIPHASVIHGTHLTPLIELGNATDVERFIIDMSRRVCLGPLNNAFHVLHRIFGLPFMDYDTFIRSETILIPQSSLPFKAFGNMSVTNFIRASFGPPINSDASQMEDACYVTFGSGNPCDISRVITLARRVFSKVVANTGSLRLGTFGEGVITKPFISSSSLAGRVAAVVSHGGIGTVGTFAEWGTPQIIVPTELDQATMAIFALRSGIAKPVGLNSFKSRSHLGRKLSSFTDEEILQAMDEMRACRLAGSSLPSSGAEEIATLIVNRFSRRALLSE